MNVNEFYEKLIKKLNQHKQPIILEQFKDITTPPDILHQLRSIILRLHEKDFQAYGNDQALVIDSYHYRKATRNRCVMPYFHQHFPTFRQMNTEQQNWYLYWRSCAVKNEYLPTHLSYLNVFFYELINYGYSDDIAFNVSMLKKLYDAYYTVFEIEHVKDWIADLLVEAGEIKKSKEYEQHIKPFPALYNALESHDLSRITMDMWKPYIQEEFIGNSSTFYKQFHQDIEQTFLICLPYLEQLYVENNGRRLVEIYFEDKISMKERTMFQYALTFRKEKVRYIEERKKVATPTLYKALHAYITLCENVTRTLKNIREQLPYDKDILPSNLRSMMMQKMSSLQPVDRFKIVKVTQQNEETPLIPKRPTIPLSDKKEKTIMSEMIDDKEKTIEQHDDEPELVISNITVPVEPEMIVSQEIEVDAIQEERHDQVLQQATIEQEVSLTFDEVELIKIKEKERQLLADYMDFSEDDHEVTFSDTPAELNLDDFLFTETIELTTETIQTFINELDDVEQGILGLFKDNLHCEKAIAIQYTVAHHTLLGIVLSSINEKSQHILGDNLIEEHHQNLHIFEDFHMILSSLEER